MRPRLAQGRPRLQKKSRALVELPIEQVETLVRNNEDQAIAITGLKAALAGARGEIEDLKDHHRKQLVKMARLR